jgi:hypothetical protein
MVGEYEKHNFLVRGLKRINPDFDEYGLTTKILKKPTPTTLPPIILPPTLMLNTKKFTNDFTSNPPAQTQTSTGDEALKYTHYANTAVGGAASVPGMAMKAYNTAAANGVLDGLSKVNSSHLYNVMNDVESLSKTVGKIGSAANVAGGVLSGISLGKDIYDLAKGNGNKLELGTKIADDATGVVSAAVSAVNPLAGLALTGIEKLVTSGIKAGEAVKEEKKREGVKHLKPKEWVNTVWDSMTPAWMNKDIGQAYRDWKAKAPERKAARKARKAAWKKMSAKEKAHRFFFG